MVLIETADQAALKLLFPHIDNEFIFKKSRTISLKQRFPSVYSSENFDNIYLMRGKNDLYASVTLKMFTYEIEKKKMSGAMVGMVYTNPNFRGKGYASYLMGSIVKKIETKIDFAVLWTTIHTFYERLGWKKHDIGMVGRINKDVLSKMNSNSVCEILELTTDRIKRIEDYRNAQLFPKVIRNFDDYKSIPIPSEKTFLTEIRNEKQIKGYSIFGFNKNNIFLYEVFGDDEVILSVLKMLISYNKEVIINDNLNSYSYQFLSINNLITWKEQNLAMWYSMRTNIELFPSRYISYLDRI